jgi:hypothetical protein
VSQLIDLVKMILDPELLKRFLEGRSWYESVTVWGCIVVVAVSAGFDQACASVIGGLPVLGEGVCSAWDNVREVAGPILITLGFARKLDRA